MTGRRWLLNLAGFQVGWFATVLCAAHGVFWLGPLVVAGVIGLHLVMAARAGIEVRLMLAALIIGAVLENALLAAGLVRYPGSPSWVPLWMLALAAGWALALPALLFMAGYWQRSQPDGGQP